MAPDGAHESPQLSADNPTERLSWEGTGAVYANDSGGGSPAADSPTG